MGGQHDFRQYIIFIDKLDIIELKIYNKLSKQEILRWPLACVGGCKGFWPGICPDCNILVNLSTSCKEEAFLIASLILWISWGLRSEIRNIKIMLQGSISLYPIIRHNYLYTSIIQLTNKIIYAYTIFSYLVVVNHNC